MPQVNVYLRKSPDVPLHRCSRTFATQLFTLFPRLVTYDKETLSLRILTNEAWSSVKARVRPRMNGVTEEALVTDSGYDHPWSWRPTGN